MLIILSPAKTMDMSPKKEITPSTTPTFISDAEYIASKMKQYSVDELAELLKISHSLAQQTHQIYEQFDNDSCSKAAIFAYNGSVFKNISPLDFSKNDLEYAQKRVRIISTLYGFVRPLDKIKAYRLTYNLKIEGIKGNLYNFWNPKLTNPLIKDIEEVGGILINLASLDVQDSLEINRLNETIKIITPEFKRFKDGEYKSVITYSKIARGAMTRYIIKERIETPEALKLFDWNGYKFAPSLSDDNNFIYTR